MSTAAKGVTKGKYGDLSRRLWFLLGALVVFRIGTYIPVPGIDPAVLADLFKTFGISVALQAQPGLVPNPGTMFQMTSVVTLVTGTMFLMWLGEQITERGLGNGISLIIFAGIAAGLPRGVCRTLELGPPRAVFLF